jgi:hypothetical protein
MRVRTQKVHPRLFYSISCSRAVATVPNEHRKPSQASHAALEDSAAYSRQLVNVFTANETEASKAQRDLGDEIRRKVLSASQQRTQAKMNELPAGSDIAYVQQYAQSSPSGASVQASPEQVAADLQKGRQKSSAAENESGALQAREQSDLLRSGGEKQRAQMEERLVEEHMAELDLAQEAQREKIVKVHSVQQGTARSRWKDELSDLTAVQAKEICQLEESVVRALALEDVDLPQQLLKHRFKPSARLAKLKRERESERLSDDSTSVAPREERELEEEEVCIS